VQVYAGYEFQVSKPEPALTFSAFRFDVVSRSSRDQSVRDITRALEYSEEYTTCILETHSLSSLLLSLSLSLSLSLLSFFLSFFLSLSRHKTPREIISPKNCRNCLSRKRVPNNRVTVTDFLGRGDPRGEEHHANAWRWRGEREPKGPVAEVTVPTASSRKANRG